MSPRTASIRGAAMPDLRIRRPRSATGPGARSRRASHRGHWAGCAWAGTLGGCAFRRRSSSRTRGRDAVRPRSSRAPRRCAGRRRGQWHVTLRFLGEVDDPDGVVDRRCAPVPGDAARPRRGRRARLARSRHGVVSGPSGAPGPGGGTGRCWPSAVAEATAPWDRHAEDRPFSGHVTVARTHAGRTEGPARLAGAPLVATPGRCGARAGGVDPRTRRVALRDARHRAPGLSGAPEAVAG